MAKMAIFMLFKMAKMAIFMLHIFYNFFQINQGSFKNFIFYWGNWFITYKLHVNNIILLYTLQYTHHQKFSFHLVIGNDQRCNQSRILSCFSHVRSFVTTWTVSHQVLLSMGFTLVTRRTNRVIGRLGTFNPNLISGRGWGAGGWIDWQWPMM